MFTFSLNFVLNILKLDLKIKSMMEEYAPFKNQFFHICDNSLHEGSIKVIKIFSEILLLP